LNKLWNLSKKPNFKLSLNILIAPASIYDGTVSISMIESFLKTYKTVFKPSHQAMDSGYDFEYVCKDIIHKYNAIPCQL
jgi:hypothetical protein